VELAPQHVKSSIKPPTRVESCLREIPKKPGQQKHIKSPTLMPVNYLLSDTQWLKYDGLVQLSENKQSQ